MAALGSVFLYLAPFIFTQALPSGKTGGAPPASQCVTETEIADPAALGLEEVRIVRWIDGDTVKFPADFCRQHKVPEKFIKVSRKEGDEPGCSGRFKDLNTTEKVTTRKQRREKEKGALLGWEFMEELVGTQTVWVKMGPHGAGYGRIPVHKMYLRKETANQDGTKKVIYLDVFKAALQAGWAHGYVYAPDANNVLPEYLPCQREAQAQGRGLWQFEEYSGSFNMTSFHANGRRAERFPYGSIHCGRGKEAEDPNCEYFRITNTSQQTVDLGGYRLKKHIEGLFSDDITLLPLPACQVPPGFSVQIFFGKGANQTDYTKEELVLFLQQEEEFWPNDEESCAIIEGPDGKTETFRPSQKGATCPSPSYRKKN
jgi:endonuclease YncB( thermonuclease family)